MSRARAASPTDNLPYPEHIERLSTFLTRWGRSPRVKREYGPRARAEGMKAWEAARLEAIVSVKTEEDRFLVFDNGR